MPWPAPGDAAVAELVDATAASAPVKTTLLFPTRGVPNELLPSREEKQQTKYPPDGGHHGGNRPQRIVLRFSSAGRRDDATPAPVVAADAEHGAVPFSGLLKARGDRCSRLASYAPIHRLVKPIDPSRKGLAAVPITFMLRQVLCPVAPTFLARQQGNYPPDQTDGCTAVLGGGSLGIREAEDVQCRPDGGPPHGC